MPAGSSHFVESRLDQGEGLRKRVVVNLVFETKVSDVVEKEEA